MANGQLRDVVSHLRSIMEAQGASAQSDSQLLADFVQRRDERAFELLVWRHGAMVLSLCERVLRDVHDAEDAFQATFLVFARKAGSIGKGESLPGWLYKVAYRVALRLQAKIKKRPTEEPIHDLAATDTADDLLWRDLRPILDEEIARLPEKYREPVVLCYLQGQSNKEAAETLGCPEGTVQSRLARGRERLRDRLTRRGLTLSVGGFALLLSQNAASASAPAPLVLATTQAALPFAAGQTATALVSGNVAYLAEGVLRTMFLAKIKTAAALVASLLVFSSIGVFTFGRQVEPRADADRANAGRIQPAPWRLRAGARRTRQAGRRCQLSRQDSRRRQGRQGIHHRNSVRQARRGSSTLNVAPSFERFVTLPATSGPKELPLLGKGDNVTTVDIKLTPQTALTYSGVVQGATRPKVGYTAEVWLERGSKSEAAVISFRGAGTDGKLVRGVPVVSGTIAAIAKEGKGITVERPAQDKGGQAERVEITIDAKTQIVFNNVAAGGDKLTEGAAVPVTFQEGSKNTAAKVTVTPQRGKPNARFQTLNGKVVRVGADGKSFTIEAPSADRGQAAEVVTIKLTQHVRVIFNGVGPDGARMTEGHSAAVWLADGAREHVFQVTFAPFIEAKRGP